MILAKMLKAKRALKKVLKTLKKTGGGKYDTAYVEADDNFTPTRDVEINLRSLGFEDVDDDLTECGHARKTVLFSVVIFVANRLANEDNPIDEVAMQVAGDIEDLIMKDQQFGGLVNWSDVRGGTVIEDLASSHYSWALLVAMNIRTLVGDAFEQRKST